MQDGDLACSMVSRTCPACSCCRCLVFFSLVNAKCSLILRLQLFVASVFSSVAVAGERVKRDGVFVVKGHSFHKACWIMLSDVLSKAKTPPRGVRDALTCCDILLVPSVWCSSVKQDTCTTPEGCHTRLFAVGILPSVLVRRWSSPVSEWSRLRFPYTLVRTRCLS